jgi:hypothetical protein
MSIRLHRLVLTGPGKKPAILDFAGISHLVFGPTDTGKSYVLECLRYGLGSTTRPRDIGSSEGYMQLSLQLMSDTGFQYTFFRDMVDGSEAVYEGFHDLPPQIERSPLDREIQELLLSLNGGEGRKLLVKAGERGNFTSSDLRRVSLFDEIETLDKVPLVGSDNLLKMRNRSSLALILSGVDDSQTTLVLSKDKRTLAKGYVEALDAEIAALKSGLPAGTSKTDVVGTLSRVTAEIDEMSAFLKENTEALSSLKSRRLELERKIQDLLQQKTALMEAHERFNLLSAKYSSDRQRLQAISTAASVINTFEPRPCPLCLTDLQHQTRHSGKQGDLDAELVEAASYEIHKIDSLRQGLEKATGDITDELQFIESSLRELRVTEQDNLKEQSVLLAPTTTGMNVGLSALAERKSELTIAARDFERLELLESRKATMAAKTKRKTQKIERDLSISSTELCKRITNLLTNWGVPGVEQVYFEEPDADIRINQRQRISFGKGKRGIFLTAYVIALMEYALEKGHPHLGFIAIDSPVVTYKDPKHGSNDSEESLDISVKDKFYTWLADYKGLGQVIVLENEEPEAALRERLRFTEFVGAGYAEGRKGFIPS